MPAILEWIGRFQPERVIVTKECLSDDTYEEFQKKDFEIQEWNWVHDDLANCGEMAEELGVPVEDVVHTHSRGHEFFSILRPWMKSLINERVILMGGFEGECLLGLEDGLDKLDVDYEKHRNRLYPREC